MAAMRVAIVDDEAEVRKELSDYLHRFQEESGVKLEAVPFASADAFLAGYTMGWNIIIFDIDMPGINGMDAARRIRETDRAVTIIFVTNIAQYAIAGYEVDAVDYILKPISYYDFSMKFRRTVEKAAQKIEHVIKIETAEGIRRVHVTKILYVEVLSHYLHIHIEDGKTYITRGNMQTAVGILAKYGFVQCHRSYMVNLRHVERLTSGEVTVAGQTLPVGRAFRDDVKQRYMQFVRGEEEIR